LGSTKSITILDLGSGNLTSLKNCLESLGFNSKITNNKKDILSSDQLVLAGTSNLDSSLPNIINNKLDQTIINYYNMNKPILGICAGMQIVFNGSEETKKASSLGILTGEFKKIPNQIIDGGFRKVPNIGLFSIKEQKINLLNKDNKEYEINFPSGKYYFQHSYFLSTFKNDISYININYNDLMIPALVAKNNFLGLQFHPELSGKSGLKCLSNYLKNTHGI